MGHEEKGLVAMVELRKFVQNVLVDLNRPNFQIFRFQLFQTGQVVRDLVLANKINEARFFNVKLGQAQIKLGQVWPPF